MRLFRHAPLTLWVVIVALLAGAAFAAMSVTEDADASDLTLKAGVTDLDRAQVQQLRNRLPVLVQLVRDDDPEGVDEWAGQLASEARAAASSRAARVGEDDELVKAYRIFGEEASDVRGSDDRAGAVDRVLAAGDLLANAAFGGDAEDLPPGFGGNLDRGQPDALGDRPQLPEQTSLTDPDAPFAGDPSLVAPARDSLDVPELPGMAAPTLPGLSTADLPVISPQDTAEMLGIDPDRVRAGLDEPELPGLTDGPLGGDRGFDSPPPAPDGEDVDGPSDDNRADGVSDPSDPNDPTDPPTPPAPAEDRP